MKKLFVTLLFFICVHYAFAQFPSKDPVPKWFGMQRVDSFLWLDTKDTAGLSPARVGTLVMRKQPGDTSLYVSNGLRFVKVGKGSVLALDSAYLSGDTLHFPLTTGGELAIKITGLPQANIIGLPDSLQANNLQRVMERGNISNRELLLDAGSGGGRLRFRTSPAALNLIYSYASGAASFRPLEIAAGGLMVSDRGGSVFDDDGINALQVNGSGYFKSVVTGVPATAYNHLTTRQQVSDSIVAAISAIPVKFPYADATLNGNRRLTGKNNAYSLTFDSLLNFKVNSTASGYSMSHQSFLYTVSNAAGSKISMNTGAFEVNTGMVGGNYSSISASSGSLTLIGTTSVSVTSAPLFQVNTDSIKFSSNNRQNIQFPNYINTPSFDSVLVTDVNGYLKQKKLTDILPAYIPLAQKGANNGVASLDAGGKVPFSQLPASLMIYKGTWIPGTNTPTLADGTGTAGWVFKATADGSANLGSGSISFFAGDFVIHNGTRWERSVGTDNVVSVNGQQGVVNLNTSNITEGTNQYWTTARGDARYPLLSGAYSNPSWLTALPWSKITGTPTTLSGYGLTDLSVAGTLSLNNATSNTILWNDKGVGLPTFGSRSPGTKLTLYPALGASSVDFGLGVASGNMWFSVPTNSNAYGFGFYGGTSQIGILDGIGNLTVLGSLSAGNIPAESTASDKFLVSSSGQIKYRTGSQVLSDIGGDARYKSISYNPALSDILTNGSIANSNITLGASGNTTGYSYISRSAVGPTTYTSVFGGGFGGSASMAVSDGTSSRTLVVEQSQTAPRYTTDGGSSFATMWHSSNHVAGSAFTPTLTGANVLAGLTTNSSGHVTAVTTRAMTPADISAAPASGSTFYINNNTAPQSSSNFNISGTGVVGGALTAGGVISNGNTRVGGNLSVKGPIDGTLPASSLHMYTGSGIGVLGWLNAASTQTATMSLSDAGDVNFTGTTMTVASKLRLVGVPNVKEGANFPMGLATFGSGTTSVVVNNVNITANTRVQLSIQSFSGGLSMFSPPYISARTPGSSFTITWGKGVATDTGTVSWLLIEPY